MNKRDLLADLSLPRMRGDRPIGFGLCEASWQFTPHARGSTLGTLHIPIAEPVYPACAGIDLIFPLSL